MLAPVKPPRTQALPSLTSHTSLVMTHQDPPGSPQVIGTFTHSYQPLRAWHFRAKGLKRGRGKVFLCPLACLILFWMPVAFPVLCPLLAHVISQGFVTVSLIPGDRSVSQLLSWMLSARRASPRHTRENSAWKPEHRRVFGEHLVSMEIWVLKLVPLLPKEGWWYFMSEPRNRSRCHLRHFRLSSAWT